MTHDIYELIGRRATCRSYKPDPIPDEVLDRILEAGCKSPSAGGFQNISIIKITDPEKRKKLVGFSRGQRFLAAAPVSLVFCIDHSRIKQALNIEPAPFGHPDKFTNFIMGTIDAAICAQTITLAAEAEGLGSCYNGNILNVIDQLTELLELPELVCPAIMLTLGWPKSENRRQPPKYPASLLVSENSYRKRGDGEVYKAYRRQNNWQKINPRSHWVEDCCALAERLHGAEYAAAVRADIGKKGYIGPYQYWFGCYYREEPDFLELPEYFEYYKKQGFGWLERKDED